MKMNVAVFILAFTMFWKTSQSVKCYKCSPDRPDVGNTPHCTHFNYSAPFVVDCTSSTMCFKRETTLALSNGLTFKAVERGCASQTMSGDQRRINGKWQPVTEVYDVYEEACMEHPTSDYQRPTKSLHCYCRGDLCNQAAGVRLALGSLLTAIIWFLVS